MRDEAIRGGAAFLDEAQLQIKVPKRCVLLPELGQVQRRLDKLAPLLKEGSASPPSVDDGIVIVPYTDIVVSPMYLSITAPKPLLDAAALSRAQLLPAPTGLRETQARPLLLRMVRGLLQLHGCGVVHGHCDLESFMVDSQQRQQQAPAAGGDAAAPRLVLVDHVVPVSFLSPRSAHGQVARRRAAPEVCANDMFSFPADVWSVGVLLLRLTLPANKAALTTADIVDTDFLSPHLSHLSSTARSLAVTCLKSDTSGRPTMWEVLEHPFFVYADDHGDDGEDAGSSSETASCESDDSESADDADDATTGTDTEEDDDDDSS